MNNSSLGIILNYYFYKETSLILDVFTKNYGRISLVAKGARRESSKYKGKIISVKKSETDPKFDIGKAVYLFNINKRYDLDGDIKFNLERLACEKT